MRPELEQKVERAIRLIKMTAGERQVEVSFSGGKDSEVILELAKMDMDACFNKYVTQESREQMKELVELYNNAPTYENFMLLVSNCPQGIELFMRVSTNYLQLRTIYKQRKNHKLREDYGAFCNWIETLPYAKELIIGERK